MGISLIGASDCGGLPPKLNADLYAGSTIHRALIRCISDPKEEICDAWVFIYPEDESFDHMICMDRREFGNYVKEVISRCEKWRP